MPKKNTSASWRRVREGWGLEKIPWEIGRDLGCTVPGPHTRGEALYTASPLPTSSIARVYDRQLAAARQTALCRHHALWLYGD